MKQPMVIEGACHPLIKQTAQEMAGEIYEELMKRNEWWESWKKQHPGMGTKALEKLFIRKAWAGLVPQARATLAGMLAGPYDEGLKSTIYDALLADGPLRQGRGVKQRVLQ